MKISPATTGETENGRSISVTSTRLSRKWNRAMDQAAARPNGRFNGTTHRAVSSVSRTALSASGSVYRAPVNEHAIRERLGKDRRQRHEQKCCQERDRDGSEQDRHEPSFKLVDARRSIGRCMMRVQAACLRLHA